MATALGNGRNLNRNDTRYEISLTLFIIAVLHQLAIAISAILQLSGLATAVSVTISLLVSDTPLSYISNASL